MKKKLLAIYVFFTSFGFDPLKMFQALRGIPSFLKDFIELKNQSRLLPQKDFKFGKIHPCLSDRFANSGSGSGHYFHQDLLIASRIFKNNPLKHIDVGSRIDGFVTHVASFREIEVFDIRPLDCFIDNVKFVKIDFSEESTTYENYCDSLSCLHVIEHFGLGRYGDKIDINGHLSGLKNLKKILKPGGKFYLSTPIGPQRIEFNAHRVFSLSYIIDILSKDYEIDTFSFIDDNGSLFKNVSLTEKLISSNFGCKYGCGIFELTKR